MIKPFLPHFCRDGNVITGQITVLEIDRNNNVFHVTKVTYTDKKGNSHSDTRFVKCIYNKVN